ncbi:MAG: carbohydrate-binding protein, partial [Bacteroidota bacterium]
IRNTYDIPLYFGETGENSNVWFRDAIRLFGDHNIGWAWWPMKKVDDIAGPLSVERTEGYQQLIDYWEGNGASPGASTAKTILMDLTEKLKLENCKYQPDVVDAMFRQVNEDVAIPFAENNIPGVIQATDYDLGGPGVAYEDNATATYHVSTGNYTAWNNGWAYRNDGVDIEASQETVNGNGYNVGWLDKDEWMQYTVDVAEAALYDVTVRVAANGEDGKFHLSTGGADASRITSVPNTGDWQNWQSLVIPDVMLTPGDKTIRLEVDGSGFNLSSLQFTNSGPTTDLVPFFVSAFTTTENRIQLNINKPLDGNLPNGTTGFSILIGGNPLTITDTEIDAENPRIIRFTVDHEFKSRDWIQLSYSGSQILDVDGLRLPVFSARTVENRQPTVNLVSERVEAEDYFFQQGVQLETTTDVGGGQNIGFLDPGDYLDYYVEVDQAGLYDVAYRTAALSETGAIAMQLVDDSGNATTLHEVSFNPTGDWQKWATTNKELQLPAGLIQLRMLITQPLFNVNWFQFSLLQATSIKELNTVSTLVVYPNPSTGMFTLRGELKNTQDISIHILNELGQQIYRKDLAAQRIIDHSIDLQHQPNGWYFVLVIDQEGRRKAHRMLKMN